ncbi:hypothetical protein Ddc_14426 [Ditylenchus destructor]|nr:hypothetical protein Ddc_14426 [Ditylenchus destructor]
MWVVSGIGNKCKAQLDAIEKYIYPQGICPQGLYPQAVFFGSSSKKKIKWVVSGIGNKCKAQLDAIEKSCALRAYIIKTYTVKVMHSKTKHQYLNPKLNLIPPGLYPQEIPTVSRTKHPH